MREEKIGEGEGNLSPSPNLSPSSPKTFDFIESPLPVFPVKTKPERNPFRLCSAAPGNLHQGWASAPPRPLPAPFMKVLGGEGWGLGKGGEALLQKGSPPFPNLLLLPFALPELPHNGLGRDDAGGGCGHDVAGHAGAVARHEKVGNGCFKIAGRGNLCGEELDLRRVEQGRIVGDARHDQVELLQPFHKVGHDAARQRP